LSFFKFLGLKDKSPSTENKSDLETIRKITQNLEKLDPPIAKHHALFACILSRVAHADLDISEEETKRMEEVVTQLGHLSPPEATLVVEIAKVQNTLLGGIENFLLTKEFYQVSTMEQRLELLVCLFAVAAADENISSIESDEIRKITKELKISHEDFIAARSQFREHLGVLK